MMNENDIIENFKKDSKIQFIINMSANFLALYVQLQKKNIITVKDEKEINKNTEIFKEHIIKLSVNKTMEKYRSQGGEK